MFRIVVAVCLGLLSLASAPALAQTTYHLHNETSTTSAAKQLRTAGPDASTVAIQTANLRSTATGEKAIQDFDTQAGIPGMAGTLPSGSTLTFQLWMRKTANVGTLFPRARVYLDNASGTVFCTATGTTGLTTTLTKYTISCNTSTAIIMTTSSRLYLRVAANMTAGSTSTNFAAELDIEGTLNASADSQFSIPSVVPTPAISGLSPNSGSTGAPVTVTGSNFGATQGTSTVKLNGTTATATSWSTNSINVTVPSGATTGNLVVNVGGVNSNGMAFTVIPPPNIASLSPTSGKFGASITVSGTGFGATQGSSTVKFNGLAGTPTSWSATTIQVPVPAGATSGNAVVRVNGIDSNGRPFTVLPSPTITNVSHPPGSPAKR